MRILVSRIAQSVERGTPATTRLTTTRGFVSMIHTN
jgi:hypothetical protein